MILSKKDHVITMFAVFGLIIVLGSSQSSIAEGAEIWDNDTSGWVSDPANGDPIDRGNSNEAIKPQVAIDSEGKVYIAYYQYDGSAYRVFLNRYDGNIVQIWSGSGWTTEFAQGTPIDKMGLPLVGAEPDQEETYGYPIDIAIDTNNVVYVVYRQSASVEDSDQIFLSRYLFDGNEEKVQIWSNTGWNTDLELGSAISHSQAARSTDPRLAVDSNNDVVYITYYQAMHHEAHIYLNRHLVVNQQESLQVWSATGWSADLDQGTHLDIGGENHHVDPRIAVDASGRVYVAYILVKDLEGLGIGRIYLSRYLNGNNGEAVQIWSDTGWTPNLETGIPIDTGSELVSGWQGYPAPAWEGGSWNVRIATGSDDIVYVSYHQAVEIAEETHWHVFLNRAIGEDIQIWSDTGSFTGWTPNLEAGTPIDKRLPHDAGTVSIAIDGNNIPYLSFMQYKGIGGMSYGIHLVRYNGGVVEIWDVDTGNWTPELEQGDPLDPLGADSAAILSELAIDINNTVYFTYIESQNSAIYLNRYSDNKVEIWDTDTFGWTSNLADGDAIHLGLPVDSLIFSSEYGCPPQTMAAKEALYVTYFQQPEMSTQHVYLSRYLDPQRSITVTSPDGGETWVVGESRNITWTSESAGSLVMIEISRDGGSTWSTITSSPSDDGSYAWAVTGPASTACRIRITSTSYPTVSDTSNANFSIEEVATGTIYGTVYAGRTRRPIRGAMIIARHEDGATVERTRTNFRGYYELTDLKAGRWRLRAQKRGYKGGKPRFVDVSPGGNYEENFRLFR